MRFRAVALALHLVAASVAAQAPTSNAPAADSARRDSTAGRPRRAARRVPVTPELERSAFADEGARTLLRRARAARLAQDSALRSYDAKTYQRISVGARVRGMGAERLLLRTEQVARVRWGRGAGLWVEPTGRRSAFPAGGASLDLTELVPIPYFPGREALWVPSDEGGGVVKAEVDEAELLHPLAAGAEAYYTYATGDSVSIRLPDGSAIALRELTVAARRPDARAFVGSFWFDVDRGSLVRAAYRLAADLDVWQSTMEEYRRELRALEARARTDTGEAGRVARRRLDETRIGPLGRIAVKLLEGTLAPWRGRLSGVTVEYGLHEGRFWLPKLHVADAEMVIGPVRLPARFEERFRYAAVNGTDSVPRQPVPGELGLVPADTLWANRSQIGFMLPGMRAPRPADSSAAARAAREDSTVRRATARAYSLRATADSLRAAGDTARARQLGQDADYQAWIARQITRRRQACAGGDSTYLAGLHRRPERGVTMAIRMPCDWSRLARSPDLPGSIYEPGEALFGSSERDALLGTLGFGLQPPWAPQLPVLRTGLAFTRYNRIEGLSLGASATSALGRGYTAQALARFGLADRVPNGELSLSRTNGRAELRLGAFHRLGVVNDDRGVPLGVGASAANLLYARDEGFYYRTWGVELAGTRDAPGALGGATLLWRAFLERQRSAGVEPNTRASLAHALGGWTFERNVHAARLVALGAGGELARTFGLDPRGARLDARLRGEGALVDLDETPGTTAYGRFVVDATLSRGLGPVAASLTGAAGTAVGDLPPQRAFLVGGLQTVRGQFARPRPVAGEGRVGDAFWLVRGELGLGRSAFARPALFHDLGWAGSRADFRHPGRPLSGAGAGLSLLDGLLRVDVSRGLWPERRWRTDVQLGARF